MFGTRLLNAWSCPKLTWVYRKLFRCLPLPLLSLDFVFQASPERSTRAQQKEFQTYVLDSVMDHLLAADVLLGNQQFVLCF